MNQYPRFIADTEFYRMDDGESSEAQLTAMLANMKVVFALTHAPFKELNELVLAYINAGVKICGLETGIVSQIEGDTYTVLDVVSNLGVISPGDVFPINGTYCYEVFSSGEVLGFPNVGALSYMKNHPVYLNLKLESYLSAPIFIEGRLFGTLNFTSVSPRENGFSIHERELITLMAKGIANFILLTDREDKLKNANIQLKKFVGFVSHDLRNPLGCIKSMSALALRADTPSSRVKDVLNRINKVSNTALEFVHSVLDLSALGAGKLQVNSQCVDLTDLVSSSLEAVEELRDGNEQKVSLKMPSRASTQVDPGLIQQALVNLLINASKYAPIGSEILLSINEDSDSWLFSLENTIDQNFRNMSEEGRYRSVGFGLDIATEILSSHGFNMSVDSDGFLFRVTFSLPRAHGEGYETFNVA